MALVHRVTHLSANLIGLPGGVATLEIAALGEVNTTGWTHPRLSPVFYITPPADGIWDFEFQADPPSGIVAQVVRPVGALYLGPAPEWCQGVRIHGAENALEDRAARAEQLQAAPSPIKSRAMGGPVIVHQTLATYDDSIQPTGTIHWTNDGPFGLPTPHIEMKKLHHRLVLTVEGPDEDQIRDCVRKAAAAGVIAAIVAAAASGGAALPAAISAALAALQQCLGDGFSARINDESHWIYWDT